MIPLEHGIKIIIRDREHPGAGAAGLTTGSCTQKFHLSIYITDAPALSPDRSRAGASAAPAGPIRPTRADRGLMLWDFTAQRRGRF